MGSIKSNSSLRFLPYTRHKLIRNYSTIPAIHTASIPITSNFLTGFTDAEGSFGVNILKNSNYSVGWQLSAIFAIKLHERDKLILKTIQLYLGGMGSIIKNDGCYILTVRYKN